MYMWQTMRSDCVKSRQQYLQIREHLEISTVWVWLLFIESLIKTIKIIMCAAISNDGALCHIPTIVPYNTECLITFLNALNERLVPLEERGLLRPSMTLNVIIWDNVVLHHSCLEWFAAQPHMMMQFLPPYSFLNPTEELFSVWRWKVYEQRPYD